MDNGRKDFVKGVKILKLYRQHYSNYYTEQVKSEYLCFGYFDGMEITDVEKTNSELYKRVVKSPVSDIWYQTAREIKKQRGLASEQHIGLFRAADNEQNKAEELFWNKSNRKAFLSTCFVQFDTYDEKEDIGKKIEGYSDESVSILTYYTFDNADMILFFQGNSYQNITKKIHQVESTTELNIAYMHSVCGVLRDVPKQVIDGNTIAENDDVDELMISIIGNVGTFEKKWKFLMDKSNHAYPIKNYGESMWTYIADHGSFCFLLPKTDMYSLLSLLVEGGVLSYTNGVFGTELYSTETRIILRKEKFEEITAKEVELTSQSQTGWCISKIDEYERYMNKAWEEHDESLYSYYQCVIQTLNALVQFEHFKLSQDIFYLVYPALELFDEQLNKTTNSFDGIMLLEQRKEVMGTILEFFESVNSIIYHAIHMDQIFLMVPGCSGTSFSIPTRLSMFYLWYLSTISEILNDSTNKYRFYLTPAMESKPYTYLAEFGLPAGDRLICIKLSQRSLYMPMAFFVIITHEIAHYVGENIRLRKKRLACVIKTLSHLLAEAIIPYWVVENAEATIAECMKNKKIEIIKYCVQGFIEHIQELKPVGDDGTFYHVSNLEKILSDYSAIILADENHDLQAIIEDIPREITNQECSFEEQIDLIEKFRELTDDCNIRRLGHIASSTFVYIVLILLKEYQEVFADMVAIKIAEFSLDDYKCAFNVSEGRSVHDDNMSRKDINRANVVSAVCFSQKAFNVENSAYEDEFMSYWPYLDVVPRFMKEYLELCENGINGRLRDNYEKVLEIRTAREKFEKGQDIYPEIYKFIEEKCKEYKNNIKGQMEGKNQIS